MSYSKLSRNSHQRKALLRDLVTDLIIHERIVTTESKAFELQKLIDKMITLAKKDSLSSRRLAGETVRNEKVKDGQTALQKLFSELGSRYKEKKGGYSRIIKTVPRRGDGAPMAIMDPSLLNATDRPERFSPASPSISLPSCAQPIDDWVSLW